MNGKFALPILLLASCKIDQLFNNTPDSPPPPPVPEIKVEATSPNPVSVSFGCPVEADFLITSVGTDTLNIESISVLASVQADAEVQNGLPAMPLELAPEETLPVIVSFDSFGDVAAELLLTVSSDDPDGDASATINMNPEAATTVTDTFVTTSGKNIDLLLVIDNSGSMSMEQTRLANNAEYIIDGLEANNSDYQIGIITTDDPAFVGDMITVSDSDPVAELQEQIIVGVAGSYTEKGIQMAIDATSTGGDAAPGSDFLRDNSTLAIVWVSDENDSSTGTLTDWASSLWSVKTNPSDVIGWGIVTDDNTVCLTAVPGDDYIDLAQTLGGSWSQICDESWQPTFEDLAATAGAQSSFPLSDTPSVSTIEVTVNGIQSTDWVYVQSTNSVAFNPGYIPMVGSLIEIKYGISDC